MEAVNQLQAALSDIEKNKDKHKNTDQNNPEHGKKFNLDYDDYGNIILYSNEETEMDRMKDRKKNAMMVNFIKGLDKIKDKTYSKNKEMYKFKPHLQIPKIKKKIPGARRFDYSTPVSGERPEKKSEELDDLYYVDYFYYDK